MWGEGREGRRRVEKRGRAEKKGKEVPIILPFHPMEFIESNISSGVDKGMELMNN